MAKNSKWIGLAGFGLLVLACFLPWTYHGDIDKTFTGFYSEKNIYGRPGKFLLIIAGLTMLSSFINLVWLKRLALFLSAINVAYAVKTFLVFGSCYLGYCPEKKIGLWLMLITTFIIFIASLFPDGKMQGRPGAEGGSGSDEI